MAERLKAKIVEREKLVDVVCGPDAYRDLPRLLAVTQANQAAGQGHSHELSVSSWELSPLKILVYPFAFMNGFITVYNSDLMKE